MTDLEDRKERLQDLSRRIENGTYKIDAAAISHAILQEAVEEARQTPSPIAKTQSAR